MDWSILTGFDFAVVWRYLPALLTGLWTNVLLTGLGFVAGGIVLGTVLAIANFSPYRLVRWPVVVFVEFWRSTPLLVQAIWMHFAFPVMSGLQTTPFQSALLAPIAARLSAPGFSACRAGSSRLPGRSVSRAG